MGYNQGLRVVGTYFNHDHTHTSLKGARMNARSIADGLKATDCPLKDFFKVNENKATSYEKSVSVFIFISCLYVKGTWIIEYPV